jgi:hypothetical protein
MFELAIQEAEESSLSVPEMLSRAKTLIVNDEDGFSEITRLYKMARSMEKEIEHQRKEANAPDQDRINERNDHAKKLCDPLKEVQGTCKQRMEAYASLLQKQKEDEQKKLIAASQMLDVPAPLPLPSSKSVKGSGALLYVSYERRFEVEQLHMVPDIYWKVDEEKLKKHIDLGYEEIPGVRIWVQEVQKVRTR